MLASDGLKLALRDSDGLLNVGADLHMFYECQAPNQRSRATGADLAEHKHEGARASVRCVPILGTRDTLNVRKAGKS